MSCLCQVFGAFFWAACRRSYLQNCSWLFETCRRISSNNICCKLRQTNVDRVSVVFGEMLILSWFILCLRFCSSIEKRGRCRKVCCFYFQNYMFSTWAFMESFPCLRDSRNREVPGSLGSCICFFRYWVIMPRVSFTRIFPVPETFWKGRIFLPVFFLYPHTCS